MNMFSKMLSVAGLAGIVLISGCSVDSTDTATDEVVTPSVSTEESFVNDLLSTDTGWNEYDAYGAIPVAQAMCDMLNEGRGDFDDVMTIVADSGIDVTTGATLVYFGVENFCPENSDELSEWIERNS